MVNYDVLAFGVHPDDLEIGIFGTLAKTIQSGKRVLLIDLTAGEMGSNGTVEIRKSEAEKAARLIGADRICLNLPDRGIMPESKNQVDAVVNCIRTYQPQWVLFPYNRDYHPDHEKGSNLVREAVFSSGLIHYDSGKELKPHRPSQMAMYYINDVHEANLYVDISSVTSLKQQALMAHQSQFVRTDDSRKTYLNDGFIEKVAIRDAYMGMICKRSHAEALHLLTPPVIEALGGDIR